ncbi:MAG: bifunctional diaminohydroxyphosphoribosylaminopyrimidine deaminase/5-amino-6-(5-phosphoribosylamino)uracil reductase RibD [Candidatus Coatesbacteria bacterium]|nr:bifunctional diaminohydroxyphosphoribosylaminopyrimidine deaminase/5-amino-6-(5-phosphoribosylamino)uracil reductase RibD [Candidatus Coatesbacteria bacterium]
MMDADARYMLDALRLAKRGLGRTSPNPMVGAVLVKDGRRIAGGFHARAGDPHAEVVAISNSGQSVEGSTLYVTLEPCCHYGRTPPCVDLIVESGISRVVVGCIDPNPLVNGKGIEALQRAGIQVKLGVLEDRCRLLNEAYFKHITTGLPFVTLKLAQTLDGRIATASGDSKWITSLEARRFVHRLRAQSDVVLVGRKTVEKDDPALTVRHVRPIRPDRPVRVVLDSNLKTSPRAKVFTEPGKAVVAATDAAPSEREQAFVDAGVEIIKTPPRNGKVDLKRLLAALGARGLTSVLCEGGATLAWELVSQRLFDKVIYAVAPKILGGVTSIPSVSGEGFSTVAEAVELDIHSTKRVGSDLVVVAYPKH